MKIKIGHKYANEDGEIEEADDGPDTSTSEGRKQIASDIIEEIKEQSIKILIETVKKH